MVRQTTELSEVDSCDVLSGTHRDCNRTWRGNKVGEGWEKGNSWGGGGRKRNRHVDEFADAERVPQLARVRRMPDILERVTRNST